MTQGRGSVMVLSAASGAGPKPLVERLGITRHSTARITGNPDDPARITSRRSAG